MDCIVELNPRLISAEFLKHLIRRTGAASEDDRYKQYKRYNRLLIHPANGNWLVIQK